MGDDNFKVIIVGGGPVGLIAAHVLLRAGIDFVLLESRPDICVNLGANLVLLPSGQRKRQNSAIEIPTPEKTRPSHFQDQSCVWRER